MICFYFIYEHVGCGRIVAPGEGFEPSRPYGHRLSRPAPYQARKPRPGYLTLIYARVPCLIAGISTVLRISYLHGLGFFFFISILFSSLESASEWIQESSHSPI